LGARTPAGLYGNRQRAPLAGVAHNRVFCLCGAAGSSPGTDELVPGRPGFQHFSAVLRGQITDEEVRRKLRPGTEDESQRRAAT